jgi:hypothetical protein
MKWFGEDSELPVRVHNFSLGVWVPAFAGTTARVGRERESFPLAHFVSGQPLSLAVKNALSPGTVASSL